MKADLEVCPCGCGGLVDPNRSTGNIWNADQPYWSYRCQNDCCQKYGVESKNQRGDGECPWCHRKREFLGHFLPGHRGDDFTVRKMVNGGRWRKPPRKHEVYWDTPTGTYQP